MVSRMEGKIILDPLIRSSTDIGKRIRRASIRRMKFMRTSVPIDSVVTVQNQWIAWPHFDTDHYMLAANGNWVALSYRIWEQEYSLRGVRLERSMSERCCLIGSSGMLPQDVIPLEG